jgi:hypothetical protein
MTKTQQKDDRSLSKRFLDVLNSDSRWWTRTEIATAINRPKSKLVPYDLDVLQELVDKGEIEQRINPKPTLHYQYRAINETK